MTVVACRRTLGVMAKNEGQQVAVQETVVDEAADKKGDALPPGVLAVPVERLREVSSKIGSRRAELFKRLAQ